MEKRNNLEIKSSSKLIAENAAAARAAEGTPTLTIPSIEQDAGLRIRYHVLQRAMLPPLEHMKKRAKEEANNKQRQELLESKKVLTLEYQEKTNVKNGNDANLSSTLVAIAQTNKRIRLDELNNDNQVGNDKETFHGNSNNDKDDIISSHPSLLRARHELVLRQSASADAPHANNTTTTITTNSNNALVKYTSTTGDEASENAAVHYVAPPRWKLAKVLVGHQGWVWTVAVDPTNSWFATGAGDGLIKVWDLTSGALKMNLTGHKEAVRTVALSTLSPYMFSASDDHAIKCWDLERNEIIRDFFGHKSAVHCLALHPKLDIVVSGGRDRTVRVWDIRTRAAIHTFLGHSDSVMSVIAQQGEPQVISGGSDGFIYLWDLIAGKPRIRLTRHKRPVRGLCLNIAHDSLISCGADDIRIWQMPSGEYVCHASTLVSSLGVAETTRSQITNNNNTTNVTNANYNGFTSTTTTTTTTAYTTESVEMGYRWSCCAMSRRGVFAVGSQDGQLALYDWNQPQPTITLDKTHHMENAIRRYAPYQFTKTKSLPGTLAGEGGINALTFDISGTRLITAESDKSVKI